MPGAMCYRGRFLMDLSGTFPNGAAGDVFSWAYRGHFPIGGSGTFPGDTFQIEGFSAAYLPICTKYKII